MHACATGGELLQEALPTAQVFKAFNTIGTPLMLQPDALGHPISMMFAGPAGPGREQVAELIADVGFEPVYVGPIRYARNLEVREHVAEHGTLESLQSCSHTFATVADERQSNRGVRFHSS
jgi:predicted dinucleotide-binding enzyme